MDFTDGYEFGCFDIDGRLVPRVFLGTSPFLGAGQFSSAIGYFNQFYRNPPRIREIFAHCIKRGINAVNLVADPVLADALEMAAAESEIPVYLLGVVGLTDLGDELKLMERLGAECVVVHASITDRSHEAVKAALRKVSERGFVGGIATHNPATTIPRAHLVGAEIVLAPVNRLGRFMGPDPAASLEAVEMCNIPVIAIKPLAAGALEPDVAFEFLAERVEGIAVGIVSREEAEETFGAARRIARWM